jgi:hypothetical protein
MGKRLPFGMPVSSAISCLRICFRRAVCLLALNVNFLGFLHGFAFLRHALTPKPRHEMPDSARFSASSGFDKVPAPKTITVRSHCASFRIAKASEPAASPSQPVRIDVRHPLAIRPLVELAAVARGVQPTFIARLCAGRHGTVKTRNEATHVVFAGHVLAQSSDLATVAPHARRCSLGRGFVFPLKEAAGLPMTFSDRARAGAEHPPSCPTSSTSRTSARCSRCSF